MTEAVHAGLSSMDCTALKPGWWFRRATVAATKTRIRA